MKRDWERIVYWILAIFGLFLVYQTIRYILGGSWALDGIVVGLLILNLSLTIANIAKLSRFEGEFGEFKRAMLTMANDFKEFREEIRDSKISYR